jgi:hypothetical protein
VTPEELNRTVEFIIESQARLAAAQEQDRHNRIEFQQWSRGITAQVVELMDRQSSRLDGQERFYRDWLKRNEDFQQEALGLLHLILDRLPSVRPSQE